jgi:hypothetical protein
MQRIGSAAALALALAALGVLSVFGIGVETLNEDDN